MAAHVGFTALARDAGLTLGQTLTLSVTVWALPSQVVFLGMLGSATLPAIMFAVTLSAIRLMPMVMAWIPLVRGPNTSRVTLVLLSSTVAITSWVFALGKLDTLPREARLPFYAGFVVALTTANLCVIALSYTTLGQVSPMAAAALVFLTPMYFILALSGAARRASDWAALGFGLALGPIFTWLVPQADILLAGVIGGTLAYVLARLRRRAPS